MSIVNSSNARPASVTPAIVMSSQTVSLGSPCRWPNFRYAPSETRRTAKLIFFWPDAADVLVARPSTSAR